MLKRVSDLAKYLREERLVWYEQYFATWAVKKYADIAEREAFYSDTDSDEKYSDYEEVVISKVKQERDIEEENSNVKRKRLILKPKIPKCIHLVQFQQTSRQKGDPGFRKVRQDLASFQNGPNQASRTSHLSLLEDNSRREICILKCGHVTSQM